MATCGHIELTLECECGRAAAAWWAETLRELAESHAYGTLIRTTQTV